MRQPGLSPCVGSLKQRISSIALFQGCETSRVRVPDQRTFCVAIFAALRLYVRDPFSETLHTKDHRANPTAKLTYGAGPPIHRRTHRTKVVGTMKGEPSRRIDIGSRVNSTKNPSDRDWKLRSEPNCPMDIRARLVRRTRTARSVSEKTAQRTHLPKWHGRESALCSISSDTTRRVLHGMRIATRMKYRPTGLTERQSCSS